MRLAGRVAALNRQPNRRAMKILSEKVATSALAAIAIVSAGIIVAALAAFAHWIPRNTAAILQNVGYGMSFFPPAAGVVERFMRLENPHCGQPWSNQAAPAIRPQALRMAGSDNGNIHFARRT